MKICTKCKREYGATLDNFPPNKKASDGLHSRCRRCAGKYRQSHRAEARAYNKKYREAHKENRRAYDDKRYSTIEGYLSRVYGSQKWRCSHKKSYVRKGIKNKFSCLDDFRDYVINILKVDPRGRQIHRIDPDGHYEPGNIEFLTQAEHHKVHVELRKVTV